jgi:hypothetical protein
MNELDLELHILKLRLSILTVKKSAIKGIMHTIIKLAFTNKTKCSFFSFIETTNDYTIIIDEDGFDGEIFEIFGVFLLVFSKCLT